MITAVCLGCSVATQPNFGSTALIAYMWNEITPHSVGGLRNHFFFTFTSISNTRILCQTHLLSFFYLTFPLLFYLSSQIHLYSSVTHTFPFLTPVSSL